MPPDPGSIPEGVAADADAIYWTTELDDVQSMQVAIATALDALMDDELLHVIDRIDNRYAAQVRPSDVLAAVLARASERPSSQEGHPS